MGYQKQYRPEIRARGGRQGGIFSSTAPSTALDAQGLIALQTTSTGAPVVYTLLRPPRTGEELYFAAITIGSSSDAPYHIVASEGTFFGSSSQDMLTLDEAGQGAHLLAFSSERWAAVGVNGASFSTST